MSDFRRKYLTITVIASMAVIFGTILGTTTAQMAYTVAGSSATMFGHAEVILTDPDGTIHYMQTDNLMMDEGLCAFAILATGAETSSACTAAATGSMNFLVGYTGTTPTDSGTNPTGFLEEDPTNSIATNVMTVTSGTVGTQDVEAVTTWDTITICDGVGDPDTATCTDPSAQLIGVAMQDSTGLNLLALDLPSCTGSVAGFCLLSIGSTIDVEITTEYFG